MKVYLILGYAWVMASSGRDGALHKNGHRPGGGVQSRGRQNVTMEMVQVQSD